MTGSSHEADPRHRENAHQQSAPPAVPLECSQRRVVYAIQLLVPEAHSVVRGRALSRLLPRQDSLELCTPWTGRPVAGVGQALRRCPHVSIHSARALVSASAVAGDGCQWNRRGRRRATAGRHPAGASDVPDLPAAHHPPRPRPAMCTLAGTPWSGTDLRRDVAVLMRPRHLSPDRSTAGAPVLRLGRIPRRERPQAVLDVPRVLVRLQAPRLVRTPAGLAGLTREGDVQTPTPAARGSKPASQANLWTDEFFAELLQRVPPYDDARQWWRTRSGAVRPHGIAITVHALTS